MLRLIGGATLAYVTYRLGLRILAENSGDWSAIDDGTYEPVAEGAAALAARPPVNYGQPQALLDDADPRAGAGARNDDLAA